MVNPTEDLVIRLHLGDPSGNVGLVLSEIQMNLIIKCFVSLKLNEPYYQLLLSLKR